MEYHLGVELFTRSTRSVALTAAGRAFFVEAPSLLERAQQAAVTARRFAEGDIGSVDISFVGSAGYEFLPKVIAEARLKQPHVKIDLSEMNTCQQHEALRARRIDLGIVRAPLLEPGYATEAWCASRSYSPPPATTGWPVPKPCQSKTSTHNPS